MSEDICAIGQHQFRAIMDAALLMFNYDIDHRDAFYKNCFNDVSIMTGLVVRRENKLTRIRVFKPAVPIQQLTPTLIKMTNGEMPDKKKSFLTEAADKVNIKDVLKHISENVTACLLYTSPSPRDRQKSRMPSSA